MTERDDDTPKTAADASGSPVEIEGEVVDRDGMTRDVPETARPARKIGRRRPPAEAAATADRTAATTPTTHEDGAHVVPASEFGLGHDPAHADPREDRFAEVQVSALFVLAALGVVVTCVGYFAVDAHASIGRNMNFVLGGGLTVALVCLGAGFCLWAKKLLPHDKAVQERHAHHSPEEEELLTEETFFKGFTQMQIGSRKLLRRSLLGALALLPVPAVLLLGDLGPLPGTRLRHTGWKKDLRLVDVETRLPIKLGDIEIGGIATVMPEGFTTAEENALAPTILIRFAPGQIRSKKESAWGAEDHVAYSKICSHAGCPISLYEQQTHHLLCPCHQSTFDMADDANVIFGPAARRLPQLKITLDADGYFRAQGDYAEPVGPSFWERG